MKRISIIVLFFTLISFGVKAQVESDGLLFSQNGLTGSARFVGTGGAFSSLGNDFTTLSWNPAGLGAYKKSEFVFTTGLGVNNTLAYYNKSKDRDFKITANIGNLGLVVVAPLSGVNNNNPGFKNLQFAVGVNRVNDYNNKTYISGYSDFTSMADAYVAIANMDGIPYYLLSGEMALAYDSYLIDTVGGYDNRYRSLFSGYNNKQSQEIKTSGSQNEIVLSAGANYSNKLYFGATIGIPYIDYKYGSEYEEIYEQAGYGRDNFKIRDTKEISGAGINLKLGMIYRPVDFLRMSLAFHTPSIYNLSHNQTFGMDVQYQGFSRFSEDLTPLEDTYQMTTPLKAIAGISAVIAQRGFISLEYEFQDPSYTYFWIENDREYAKGLNSAIANKYKEVHAFRVGGEYTVANMALRAGYGFYTSPYNKDVNGRAINKGHRQTISAGIGYKGEVFYFDAAFVYAFSQEDYYFYNPSLATTFPINKTINKFSLVTTFGLRF